MYALFLFCSAPDDLEVPERVYQEEGFSVTSECCINLVASECLFQSVRRDTGVSLRGTRAFSNFFFPDFNVTARTDLHLSSSSLALVSVRNA